MEANDAGCRSISAEDVYSALRRVVDPEVGMNIVDLGLVYRVEVSESAIEVDMTMTSPACPMGEMLIGDVEAALQSLLPEGADLKLQLVWEPAWSPALMSEAAREHFGWEG